MSRGYWAKVCLCFIIASFTNATFGGIPSQEIRPKQTIDWDRVNQNFSAFSECPSAENSELFMDSLPIDKPKEETGARSTALYNIIDSDNYTILEREIWGGNKYATEAAFRLLNLSDGDFTETIEMTLGTLVRINPRLFLEMLLKYQESAFIKELGTPVDVVEPVYWERERAYGNELKMRVKALESIEDEKLIELREGCKNILLRRIKSLKTIRDYPNFSFTYGTYSPRELV